MRPKLVPTPRVLLALAFSGLACADASPPAPTSIVFVSIDTLSAEHTSLHGYERATTPTLDLLAREAVVFDACQANAPWTTPSYLSQFSGLLPPSLRPVDGAEGDAPAWHVPAARPMLAEMLADAGWHTAAFLDNPNAGSLWGLDRGFEHFDESAARIELSDPTGGIRHITPLALTWLDTLEDDAPFFLFVQVLDVHGPYVSPPEFVGHFAGPAPDAPRVERLPVALEPGLVFGAVPRYVADPLRTPGQVDLAVEPILNAYDDGIAAVDADLAVLLDGLRARGILERALLVVSADHGEGLGRHDSWFDHELLHGDVLSVPLLMRPPSAPDSTTGTRITSRVQLADLYPTLLDVAGLTPPPETPGSSLLPALRGEPLPDERALPAWGDVFDARSVTAGRWRLLIEHPLPENAGVVGYLSSPWARAWIAEQYPDLAGRVYGTAELPPSALEGTDVGALFERSLDALQGPFVRLYDLASDPEESRDVAAEHPEVVARLRTELERLEQRASAQRGAGAAGSGEDRAQWDEELRKLGYVEGER